MTQYSLFGAAASIPAVADLDALVLAGAQWLRRPGGTRQSIVVKHRWRADGLAAEFFARGLATDTGLDAAVVEAAAGYGVRTEFTGALDALAASWTSGSRQRVPAGFTLGAAGLRLWAIASGVADEGGYLFRTPDGEPELHRTAGGALAGLGVTAVALGNRSGPGWRVTSTRRLRRLAELVGPPPDGGAGDWPQLLPGRLPGPAQLGNR